MQQREREMSTADLAGAAPREQRVVEERARDEALRAEAAARAPEHRDTVPVHGGEVSLQGDPVPRRDEVPARAAAIGDRPATLFNDDETSAFRNRWTDVQAGFVDEPRRAVEQADRLVAEVMQRLAQVFADERSTLEGQWDRGDRVSTEDLRVALQRYRAFFDRLLSI